MASQPSGRNEIASDSSPMVDMPENPLLKKVIGDSINKKFWDDQPYHHKIGHTKKPSEVDPAQYVAIHFAGGHGAMWDFADDKALATIAAKIYENNGIVSAVCHGPAGLVNIKLSNGKYLVDGKRIRSKSWGILFFRKDLRTVFKPDNRAVFADFLPLFSLEIW